MKLTKRDKETVVLYNEAQSTANVYTHDPKLKEKLKRLSEKYPDKIIFNTENSSGGGCEQAFSHGRSPHKKFFF